MSCCGFSEQGSCVVLLCERQVHVYQAPELRVDMWRQTGGGREPPLQLQLVEPRLLGP